MIHNSEPAGDVGFTLVEMVIALLIMATAVVTIVGALSAMVELTGQHRGHAVTEVAARSFSEVTQQQARFATALTAPVDDDDGSVNVASTALLPRIDPADADNMYVSIGREVMRVTDIGASSLTVQRDVNQEFTDPTEQSSLTHAIGTDVVPILRCPTAPQLTPDEGTYEAVEGVQPVLKDIEYWDTAEQEFVSDRGACLNGRHDTAAGLDSDGYDESCDDPDTNRVFVLPGCGWGLYRATVEVTTPGDGRLRAVSTSTKVLLRAANG